MDSNAPLRAFGLTLRADPDLLGVLTGAVEQGARAFLLGDSQAMNLALGAEELFLKFCKDQPDLALTINLVQTAIGVRLDLRAKGVGLDLRAFNLTAAPSADREEELEDLGLFLAARLVDDLDVAEDPGGILRVTLARNRVYPPVEALLPPVWALSGPLTVRIPTPAELQHFARLQAGADPAGAAPEFLRTPGMLADLVAGGELKARLAFGPREEVAGGIFWTRAGGSAQGFGPFSLLPEGAAARLLLDACVGELARSQVVGVLFLDPPECFPVESCETVGTLEGERPARFRLLHEDPGCVAWVDPALEPWLREAFARLVLPREIRLQTAAGERQPGHSVLFARLQRARGRADLRPVRPGRDLAANLQGHLQRFHAEGIRDVRCTVDLGQAWQAPFSPVLLEAGFTPRLLLPYHGRGDQVLFQRLVRG